MVKSNTFNSFITLLIVAFFSFLVVGCATYPIEKTEKTVMREGFKVTNIGVIGNGPNEKQLAYKTNDGYRLAGIIFPNTFVIYTDCDDASNAVECTKKSKITPITISDEERQMIEGLVKPNPGKMAAQFLYLGSVICSTIVILAPVMLAPAIVFLIGGLISDGVGSGMHSDRGNEFVKLYNVKRGADKESLYKTEVVDFTKKKPSQNTK